MGPGGDAAEHRVVGPHSPVGEQAARETIGERGLADASGAGDEPGMVQPAAGVGLRPDMLGRFMAEQLRVGARFGVDQFAPSS
jgi:hypothetical protein